MSDYNELIKQLRNRRMCIQGLGTLNDYPLLGEAADAIELLQKLYHSAESDHNDMRKAFINEVEKHRWISVEERLPEEPGEYIVFIRDPFYGKDEPQDEFNVDASYATSCFYDKDAGLWREGEDNYYCANLQCVNTAKMYYITHWMPLSEPPKEE